MFKFRNWFIESDISKWQEKIKSINREFVFDDWFPSNGKVILPLENKEDIDEDLLNYFKDHEKYEIYNYKKGLAKDKKYNRIINIGKILQQELKRELNELELNFSNHLISLENYKRKLDYTKRYYKNIISVYNSSVYRTGKDNNYVVIISKNVDDIASMSTNRDWTSCMDLDGGSNHESIYCEVKNGGFVAYLCKNDDLNIDKPLARIHIRRFDSKKTGKSIAVMEDTIYGNNVPGFQDIVQKWLDSKQGRIKAGRYIRRGGWYSDTFGTADPNDSKKRMEYDMMHTFYPQTAKGLFKLLEKKINKGKIINNSVFFILNKLLDPKLTIPEDIKYKFIGIIKDKFKNYESKLLLKFPELINDVNFKNLSSNDRLKIAQIDNKFNNMQEDYIKNLILSFDINDPSLKINKDGEDDYESYAEILDIIREFSYIKKLTEPLIKKIVSIGEYFLDSIDEKDRKFSSPTGIIRTLLHTLYIGKADTPTVINFYKKLLPHFDLLFDELGICLAILKENGKIFLDFLMDKERENRTNPNHLKLERIRYIIDSIENKTGRSDKYRWY